MKKKLKKEKASKHLDTSEAAPAVAAEVRPSGQAGSSNLPAAVKPKKQQRLKTDEKVAQAATGSIPPANGKEKPTAPHSKPEKASASGVAKAFAGAATEGGKRAQKMVAASDDAVVHDDDDEEHESESDDDETTIAGGESQQNPITCERELRLTGSCDKWVLHVHWPCKAALKATVIT